MQDYRRLYEFLFCLFIMRFKMNEDRLPDDTFVAWRKKVLVIRTVKYPKKNFYYRLEIIVCVFLSERFDTGYLCYIHLKPILWGFAY